MSTSSPDSQPTRVLPQQTAEQPPVSTAPATRGARIWAHVPARVGRARTSTLVVGCLFVLLLALNAALPRDEGGTTQVTTSDGRVIEIPSSYVPSDPTTPAPAPVPGSTPATTSAPAGTSAAPRTSDAEPESTPSETTRTPSRSTSAPSSSERSSATSRAPSSTAEPSESAAPSERSSAPSS